MGVIQHSPSAVTLSTVPSLHLWYLPSITFRETWSFLILDQSIIVCFNWQQLSKCSFPPSCAAWHSLTGECRDWTRVLIHWKYSHTTQSLHSYVWFKPHSVHSLKLTESMSFKHQIVQHAFPTVFTFSVKNSDSWLKSRELTHHGGQAQLLSQHPWVLWKMQSCHFLTSSHQ